MGIADAADADANGDGTVDDGKTDGDGIADQADVKPPVVTSPSPEKDSGGTLPIGMLAGIAGGVIVLMVIIVMVMKMKKKPEDGDDKSTKVQPIGSIGNLADDNERNAQRAWG